MTLEQLLNKLIEKGWKPRGYCYDRIACYDCSNTAYLGNDGRIKDFSINDLCSIDSDLWQFVCEKGLQDDSTGEDIITNNHGVASVYNYRHRLMLSSIQEDKEKFLLDNIKID